MMAANILVSQGTYTKKIENFINKLFKMADGFATEYNGMRHADQCNKGYITKTFEAFRKRKEH